jgi:PTH1 family peptidyl-tRNA hydrolase
VVKCLVDSRKAVFKKDGRYSLSSRIIFGGQEVLAALPLTYMNLSGEAVFELLNKYGVDERDDLLVIYDDMDLDFGRVKIKPQGAWGGHKGVRSVIDSLKTREFSRLRLGIGRPAAGIDTCDYVLSDFSKSEKKELERMIPLAVSACEIWATEGITAAMNAVNKGK